MVVTKGKIVPNNKMKVMKKSKKKMDMSNLSGNNEAKQNGGSESKLYKGKKGKTKNKNFIAGAIKKPGALHAQLGIKQGSKIPAATLAAAAKKGGKEGQRARLAETLKGFHKNQSVKKSAAKTAGQKAYLKRVGTKGMQC